MIFIKEITIRQIDQLVELFNEYRIFYGKDEDKVTAKQFLQDRIKNNESVIFVAVNDNDQLVGFVQLYPLFSSTNMGRIWLLNDLYVAPDHRGLKISKLLIERAKELARETNAVGISLETAKTNDIGNNLYPVTEFEVDEDHMYYFWGNDDRK